MAKIKLLVDTDVFIDYFNHGKFSELFNHPEFDVHYSVVTRKELLSKPGLKDSEKKALETILAQYREIFLNFRITELYTEIKRRYPRLEKEDALIAATALSRHLALVTRNRRHFKFIQGLTLFSPG